MLLFLEGRGWVEFEKGNIKREHGIQPELFIKRIHLILKKLK